MAADRDTQVTVHAGSADEPTGLPPFMIDLERTGAGDDDEVALLRSLLAQVDPAKAGLLAAAVPLLLDQATLLPPPVEEMPLLQTAGGPASATGGGSSSYGDDFGATIEGLQASDTAAEDLDSINFLYDGQSFGQPLAPLLFDDGFPDEPDLVIVEEDFEEEDSEQGLQGNDELQLQDDNHDPEQNEGADEDQGGEEDRGEAELYSHAGETPLTSDGAGQQLWGDLKVSGQGWDGGPAAVLAYGNGDGLGIAGGRIGQQIDYSTADGGKSEALIVEFPGAVDQAVVGVTRLFAADNGNGATKEMGHWAAYDGDELVGEADFGSAAGHALSLTIEPGMAFTKLIFTAIDYNADSSLSGSDSSDYAIQSIGWTPAEVVTIVEGTNGADNLTGGAGVDQLSGKNGQDELHGGDGDDSLFGGNHRDRLFGEEGDDLLDGGRGADFLTGGADADVFLFDFEGDQGLNGRDRVTDFSSGEGDSLRFANLLDVDGDGADLDDLLGAISEVRSVGGGQDLRIDFADGGGVILHDVVQVGLDSLNALLDPSNGVTIDIV